MRILRLGLAHENYENGDGDWSDTDPSSSDGSIQGPTITAAPDHFATSSDTWSLGGS